MSTIRILSGSYRNQKVRNQNFTLVKGFQTGKLGSYVTVKNEGQFDVDIDIVKVKVKDIASIQYLDGAPIETAKSQVVEPVTVESDEQAMNRIAERFAILDEMSKACIAGDIRSLIVTGPPGVGKSHGVTLQMEKASLFDKIAGRKVKYQIVKGAMSAIGLFAFLYKFSDHKNVLVFYD